MKSHKTTTGSINKIVVASVSAVVIAASVGVYLFAQHQAASSLQAQRSHCLDQADAIYKSDVNDLNTLGVANAASLQKAQDDHASAVLECQIRYQDK